jgi:integrase
MAKPVDRTILTGQESMIMFRAAIKNRWTRDPYERRLVNFFNIIKMTPDEFVSLAKNPQTASEAEKKIVSFILKENDRKENGKITASTVGNVLKAIRTLLEMNDVFSINWKKIRRILPKARKYALDRNPTSEEIRDILEVADVRGKPLTLLFTSGGIREGAVEGLKVRDYTRIDGSSGQKIDFRYKGELTSSIGRLVVYNGEPERYITFITSEACDAIDKYLEFRAEHGEMITDDSPLFRDKFDPVQGQYGHGKEDSLQAIAMTPHSIRQYYNRLLFSIGIRKQPKRRHEFSVNGFRKFFKTSAEQSGMKPINVEILMGHSVGISDSYYRPTEQDLREDYLKVVDKLMVLASPQLVKLSESHQLLLQEMESKDVELQGLKEQMGMMQRGLKLHHDTMKELESSVKFLNDEVLKYRNQFGPRSLIPKERQIIEDYKKQLAALHEDD